jgi:hypothetical protein
VILIADGRTGHGGIRCAPPGQGTLPSGLPVTIGPPCLARRMEVIEVLFAESGRSVQSTSGVGTIPSAQGLAGVVARG